MTDQYLTHLSTSWIEPREIELGSIKVKKIWQGGSKMIFRPHPSMNDSNTRLAMDTRNGQHSSLSPTTLSKQNATSDPVESPRDISVVAVRWNHTCMQIQWPAQLVCGRYSQSTDYFVMANAGGLLRGEEDYVILWPFFKLFLSITQSLESMSTTIPRGTKASAIPAAS